MVSKWKDAGILLLTPGLSAPGLTGLAGLAGLARLTGLAGLSAPGPGRTGSPSSSNSYSVSFFKGYTMIFEVTNGKVF